MIKDHRRAVEDEREDWRPRKVAPTAKDSFEKRDDAGHVRHQKRQPKKGDQVKYHKPRNDLPDNIGC